MKKEKKQDEISLCRAMRSLGAQNWSEEDKFKLFMNIFHPEKKLNKKRTK